MAALLRHGALKVGRFAPRSAAADFATKAEKKKGLDRKRPPTITATAESIAAKGFLRPQKAYAPPEDVGRTLSSIFQKIAATADGRAAVKDLAEKFRLCSACAEELNHKVPNSLLHTMDTLDDIRKFYRTPVDTVTPLDRLRDVSLPENLHVQFEYHRFHPDTDTMFKGQTAFNRSSTIVTGLKYKDKYKGHVQNQEWPFNS